MFPRPLDGASDGGSDCHFQINVSDLKKEWDEVITGDSTMSSGRELCDGSGLR